MRTITIDIINEKAINWLRDLELLKLVCLRKDKSEPKTETNWLKFKDAMTKQPLNTADDQFNQLRSEWE